MERSGGKNFVNPGNVKLDDPKAEIAREEQILHDLVIERGQTGLEAHGDGKEPLVSVLQDDRWVILKIAKSLIKEAGPRKALALAQLASGNLFTPQPEIRGIEKKPGRSCAFFSDGRSFYTGGRYSVFTHAVLLAEVVNVTWLTDEPLPFEDDFPGHNVKIICDANIFTRKHNDLDVDFVVGLPNLSGQAAFSYGEQFDVPCYLVMFEAPNFIREFRKDGEDAKESYWEDYKKCMRGCAGVIAHSHTSAGYTREWLATGEGAGRMPPIRVVNPTWNKRACDEAVDSPARGGVVFCSRSAPFKDPYSVLVELDRLGFTERVMIIGKTWNTERYDRSWSFPLEMLGTIDDDKKFRALKAAKILAMPSMFEGFGMPPMEAMVCGTPVVAYDLPVLRETYVGFIDYIPLGKAGEMAAHIIQRCSEELLLSKKYTAVTGKLSPRRTLTQLKKTLPGPLTLGVGMIAYDIGDWVGRAIENAAQYADELYIVHGRCADFPEAPHGDQHTIEEINEAVEKVDIPVTLHFCGANVPKNKVELQNIIAGMVEADIYMKQDADEFWRPEDVRHVMGLFCDESPPDIVKVNWVHFWKNLKTIAADAGGKWTTKHPRFWRWRDGFSHTFTHNNFCDTKGELIEDPEYVEVMAGVTCYHTGYARTVEQVQRKLAFYKARNIEGVVIDTFTDWKPGDRTQTTQNIRSWAEKFEGELPEILKDA